MVLPESMSTMVPADGKMALMKTNDRWSFYSGWIGRWRKMHLYRAKAIGAAAIGVYFLASFPLISLIAFLLAAYFYQWSKNWQMAINSTKRTVLVAK